MGQGFWIDLLWRRRFRSCATRPCDWQPADPQLLSDRPELLRFADWPFASTRVEDQRWVVLERLWAGFPDPPRYVFFALKPDGTIWAARDFHDWPAAWRMLEDET